MLYQKLFFIFKKEKHIYLNKVFLFFKTKKNGFEKQKTSKPHMSWRSVLGHTERKKGTQHLQVNLLYVKCFPIHKHHNPERPLISLHFKEEGKRRVKKRVVSPFLHCSFILIKCSISYSSGALTTRVKATLIAWKREGRSKGNKISWITMNLSWK